jgi:hypothetical protein
MFFWNKIKEFYFSTRNKVSKIKKVYLKMRECSTVQINFWRKKVCLLKIQTIKSRKEMKIPTSIKVKMIVLILQNFPKRLNLKSLRTNHNLEFGLGLI